MEIKVQIKPDVDKLVKKFEGFEQILFTKLREAIWGYALLVERGAKMFAPVDSGRMRSSIGITMKIADRGLSATVAPNVSYAFYVHEGTRYMKGRPFMEWGLNAYKREGEQLINNKISDAINQLGVSR